MIATFASVPSPLPAGSGCSQCMRAFRHLSGMSSPSAGSLRAPSGGGAVVNVVSYNVLSDSLCNAKSYPCMDPEHLLPEPRLELVKAKLRAQMEVNQPVIALQEISTAWAGRLYPFFLSRDYEFITSHYGKPFNGYMGVALAYPRGKYDLLDADIKRISDVKAWPDPPPVEKAPTPTLLEQLATLFSKVLQALGLVSRPSVGRPKRDTWGHARSRSNTMVSLRLADRSDPDAKFSVSTYHMPCAFYDPPMMTIHSALSAQHAHAVADGLPYVYMGDFNLKPGDGGYRLLTNGELPDDDDAQPTPRPGDPWRPTLSVPLTSAYAAVLGKEPLATNHTISFADHKPFTDCLDYIFCSPGIKPVDVMQLADPSTVPPSPNAQEPSDHWMVAAALELPKAP